MEEHSHTKGFCEDGQLGTDVTVTNDTEGFASNFPAALGLFVPDTLTHLETTLEVLSRESNDFGQDELSDGTRIREGGVEDGNTSLAGGVEVNLVSSNAEATNDK